MTLFFKDTPTRVAVAVLRIAMGWIFFWAFLDKTFGLGFSTASANAWIRGGSPCEKFLLLKTTGPFAFIYQSIAHNTAVEWLFMLGLFGIGTAFLFGIATRLTSIAGILFLLLIWLAMLPPATNPFLDVHIIYALVCTVFLATDAGHTLGFGRRWNRSVLVQALPFLK